MDLFANIRVFTAEIFLFFFIRVWSKWIHPLCWKLHVIKKIVGKSTRKQPERYCRWFWVDCSSKKFKRMTLKAMDVCLRVLKESSKSKFDRCNVRNRVYIDHIPYYFSVLSLEIAIFIPTTFLERAVSLISSILLVLHSAKAWGLLFMTPLECK